MSRSATDAGFDEYVAGHARSLWRTAWLLTGDSHRAEDLVQTALTKTYPHYQRVSDGGSFDAYVRRTLFTSYLAWWRRRWTGEIPAEVDPALESPGATSAVRIDVARALASLPRAQRAAIVLIYFEDLTQAEAARLLGVSVGTIKSNTSRALAALRLSPILNEETPDD